VLSALIGAFALILVSLLVAGLRDQGSLFQGIPDDHHQLRRANGIKAPEISRDEAIATAMESGRSDRFGAGGVKQAYLVWEKDVSKEPVEDRLVWALSFEIAPGTQELAGPCAVPFEASYALAFIDAHTGEYLSTSEGWLLVPSGTPAVTRDGC
jgi:hypothetical protein